MNSRTARRSAASPMKIIRSRLIFLVVPSHIGTTLFQTNIAQIRRTARRPACDNGPSCDSASQRASGRRASIALLRTFAERLALLPRRYASKPSLCWVLESSRTVIARRHPRRIIGDFGARDQLAHMVKTPSGCTLRTPSSRASRAFRATAGSRPSGESLESHPDVNPPQTPARLVVLLGALIALPAL